MKSPSDHAVKSPEEVALHTASLLYGYIWESLTPEEHDELDNWVADSDHNLHLFEELTDEKNIKKALDWLSDSDAEGMAKKLKGKISFTDRSPRTRFVRQARLYAVAASVILIVSTSAFYFYTSQKGAKTGVNSGVKTGVNSGVKTGADSGVNIDRYLIKW